MKKLITGIAILAVVGGVYWYNQRPVVEEQDIATHADEATETAPELIAAVGGLITGRWQSTDDANFIREFNADGTATDWYQGTDVSSGSWSIFTKEQPVQVTFPLESGATYLQLEMVGSQAEYLHFKIVNLTPETLEMIYMDRGGVLRFTRV